jgi:transcriptional regulator with XRE-family HTH domain
MSVRETLVTRAYVAECLGVSQQTIARWERSGVSPIRARRTVRTKQLRYTLADIEAYKEWLATEQLEEIPLPPKPATSAKAKPATLQVASAPADLSAVLDYPVELLTDEQRGLFDTKMNWSISQGDSQESAWNWARNFVCAQFLLGEYAGGVYNSPDEDLAAYE